MVEERRQHRRAKVERKLRKRSNRISSDAVEDVVCLKTLCDKVAQIERSKLEKLKVIFISKLVSKCMSHILIFR